MKRRQVQTTLGEDATVCKKGRSSDNSPDIRDVRETPPDSAPRPEDCDAYWAARAQADAAAAPPVPVKTDEADLATPVRPEGAACVKVVTWNVAGFRAVLKKGFRDYVAREQPDVLCLQETKVAERMVPAAELPPGYASVTFYECADTPGRHGTALLARTAPLAVRRGLGDPALDREGRAITAEYPSFFVVCTYVPNSSEGLVHWAYRCRWDAALLAYLQELDARKPVVWCGDLNVAHRWVDIYNPKPHVCDPSSPHALTPLFFNVHLTGHRCLSHVHTGTDMNWFSTWIRHQLNKTPGFLYGERDNFTKVLSSGFVDVYEHFYPGARGMFTFWSYRGGGRAKNNGWRLDYFVVSERALGRVLAIWRRPTVMGSDHCPLGILFSIADSAADLTANSTADPSVDAAVDAAVDS